MGGLLVTFGQTSGLIPRHDRGGWTSELVWLHHSTDILIWLAYLAIPVVLIYFVRHRPRTPFPWIFWMFGAFIVCSGFTHLLEVISFYTPAYWLAGVVKLVTAVVSWATVVALIPLVPKALAMRGPEEFESEIAQRQRAEAHFRELLETAPEAMLIIKKEGEIVLVNSKLERLFGYNRVELLGRPAEMLVPARLRSGNPMRRSGYFSRTALMPLGKESERDLYALRKDGSEFPVEISLSPLRTAEGALVSSTIRDVTERKRAEAIQARHLAELARSESALRQQSGILKSILDSIGDGVLVIDEEGKFLLFNPAAAQILGMGPAESITETWTKRYGLFLPDTVTPYPTQDLPLTRAMRGEAVDGAEIFIRHAKLPAGIWASTTARPLRDEHGKVRGGVLVFRDITERRRAEEQLRAYADRLQRSNRELQDFASVASHDLQEPLRKVQAFGDRLKMAAGPALGSQEHDYLDRMLTAAARMRTLIDDLLTFSRVTTKAQPFLPVNLAQVTREVLGDLEGRIQQTGGRVEVGELPTIDADPLQMRQLLQNLIGNGLKFHRQEAPPVIKVQAQLDKRTPCRSNGTACAGSVCLLSIQDNGIGFDEKYLGRLFQVFQRLHSRSEYEGTGMGLAICRRIVERHGGSITATSQPGQGSTFMVTLPIRQPREGTP